MPSKNTPTLISGTVCRRALVSLRRAWIPLGLLLLPYTLAQTQPLSLRIGSAQKAQRYARYDLGPLPPSQQIHDVVIQLEPGPGRAALEDYANGVQNPNSPDYHRWLTPEQFADRFGAAPLTVDEVVGWLNAAGASDVQISRGRLLVRFNATAAEIEPLFGTELHRFLVDGREHYANVQPPAIPPALSGRIATVRGLDNFSLTPQILTDLNATEINALGPGDLSVIYDLNPLMTEDASGKSIALAIVGRTPMGLEDYRAYREEFGLPANDFNAVAVPDGGNGTGNPMDEEEATLDLEIAGAAAPRATLLYVWDDNIDTAVEWVIDNDLAKILNESYAGCEDGGDVFYQTLALQAAVEGITWISAAGDSGAAGCDPEGLSAASEGMHTVVPASAPFITAVGGSALITATDPQYWSDAAAPGAPTAIGYIPETGWSSTNVVLGGGGGVSQIFGKPGYQTDFLPGAVQGRMLPDVSFSASPVVAPYYLIYAGRGALAGGTSTATALFSGILALVESDLQPGSATGLGSINPELYRLIETGPSAFHDIVTGSNKVPCIAGTPDCAGAQLGYDAAPGYDLATGLGSIDAAETVRLWNTADFTPSIAELSPSSPQSHAEETVSLTATVKTQDGPLAGSPVQFYFFNPAYQAGEILLATVPTDANGRAVYSTAILPGGVNTVQALATGTTAVTAAPLVSTTVTVTQLPTSVAIYPPANLLSGQSAILQAQIVLPAGAALNGPAGGGYSSPGEATLYTSDGAVFAGPVSPDSSGAVALTTPPLSAGTISVYAVYSGNAYFAGSQSDAMSITVGSGTGGAPGFSLTGPASISLPAGSTVTLTLYLSSQNGFNQAVQLDCSGLPAGDSCTLPGSVTFSGTAVTLPLTICTASASFAFLLPLALPLAFGAARRRAIWLLLGVVVLAGCGSAPPLAGPPAVTYPVTIEASSGAIVHSLVVNVTIVQ